MASNFHDKFIASLYFHMLKVFILNNLYINLHLSRYFHYNYFRSKRIFDFLKQLIIIMISFRQGNQTFYQKILYKQHSLGKII